MKKIISFLCAIAFVISANAAPQFATKRFAVEKQKFEQKASLKRAPKAAQAETDVQIVKVESSYKDGVLSMGLIAADRVFALEINLPQGVTDLESGKTYTIADMIANGCAGYDNSFTWFVMFTSVSLTKTVDTNGTSIVADITDDAGDKWHLTYSEAPQTPAEEIIDIEFTTSYSAEYYKESNDWYLVAQNEKYAVVLDIFSDNDSILPAGSYETKDFDLSYTFVIDAEVSTSDRIKATSAAAEVSMSGDTTYIIAVLKCTDNKTYRAKMFKAPFIVKEAIDVEITDIASQNYSTDMYYVLNNAAGDSLFYFDIYLSSGASDIDLNSTYTLNDMMESYSFMKLNGSNIAYQSAEFTKTKVNDLVHIEALVIDKDGNAYKLTYQEKGVEPTGEEVTLAFDSAMAVPQYYTDGQWELYTSQGDTAAYFVYNSSNSQSPAGTFSAEDLDPSYSGLVLGENVVYFHSGSFVVTDNDERIDLKADLLGKNGVLYHIGMFFIKPQATASDTITSTNLQINTDYYDWYGVGVFSAQDDNYSIEMTININGKGAAMAGTYVVGTDLNGTITPAAEGSEKVELYSGTITITVAENGDVNLTGKVLGMNKTEYVLNLTYIKPEPQTFNITIGSAVGEYQETNGRVQYTLNSEDLNYKFFFSIWLPDTLQDVELGTSYTFSVDMRGNANSSYGMLTDGSYTYIDYAEATFVKSIVDNHEHIDVVILDVDGNTWNLSYVSKDEVITSLDNINATNEVKAAKRLENGRVVIEKNGLRYGINGAVIR